MAARKVLNIRLSMMVEMERPEVLRRTMMRMYCGRCVRKRMMKRTLWVELLGVQSGVWIWKYKVMTYVLRMVSS